MGLWKPSIANNVDTTIFLQLVDMVASVFIRYKNILYTVRKKNFGEQRQLTVHGCLESSTRV